MNFKIGKEKRILFLCVAAVLAAVIVGTLVLSAFSARRSSSVSGEGTYKSASKSADRRSFLLLGRDRASGLTDVMMLVSLDIEGEQISVLQIPRDTYAEYTATGYRKLNGALGALGADGVCEFLSNTLRLNIDGYAVFDLDSFAKVVDMIGGVEVDIPFDMEYRDPYQDLHISISAGRQTLDGERAEQFVRYRFGYVRGDLGRIDAQKLFMSALFKKVTEDVSRFELLKIATSLLDEIDTNVALGDAISLASSVLSMDAEHINMLTLAGEDVRSERSGAWFYVISKSAAHEQLSTYMGADADVDGFDSAGAFLHEGASEFSKIYTSYVPYSVSNAKNVNENGIDIEKR